ncbi:MauE/DoxX family redox-associated membrane protein [Brumicola blandensis]|uniref:Methylamine utilization protein MauE n=1 Tax=Brumicola blandensis TaxID=3075611 RepID=A0AAW8R025_9ALTE|nr:MauE/DoxX family redox-associated membrane protein [Alteromonas sp. W409]MDT0581557.1 glutaredoxin domain-containing protein [Alteromonas sp. W409]
MKKSAILYRMETSEHICPFGLRAKDLLLRHGYDLDDRVLSTKEESENLKQNLGVKTTPQVVINDERVGGFEELQKYLGKKIYSNNLFRYFPVIALFSIAALLSAGLLYHLEQEINMREFTTLFVGLSMALLGLLKLQDLGSFVNGFLAYDLLAKRYVPYAFVYPFAEVLAGILMVSGIFSFISIPIMIFIGGIGGISVVKAVYVDKRELKCACVGGNNNVPLAFVSFSENAIMFAMGCFLLFVDVIH